MKTEHRLVVARDSGEERMGSSHLFGTNFQIYKMTRIMGLDGGDACMTM